MRPLRSLPCVRAALAVAALFFAAGCSHYRLGQPANPAFRSLYVAPVVNQAFIPQATALVNTQVRQTLATDGRIELAADAAAGDVTLAITLLGYQREVVAARRSDTGLARKFAITLRAEITATNREGRKLLDRRSIVVTREIFTDSGQQQAEYENLPLLAEALAREIAHVLHDTW